MIHTIITTVLSVVYIIVLLVVNKNLTKREIEIDRKIDELLKGGNNDNPA